MEKTHNLKASIQIKENEIRSSTTIVIDDRFMLYVGATTEVWDRTVNEKVHTARTCTEAMKWVAHFWEKLHADTRN
jgi:hypothetical protein